MSRDATMNNLLAAARRTNAKEVLEQDDEGHPSPYLRLIQIPTNTLVLAALNSKLPTPETDLGPSTSCSKNSNKEYKGSLQLNHEVYKFQDQTDTWQDKTILTALHTISDQTLKGSSSLLISRDPEDFFQRYQLNLQVNDINEVCEIYATNNPRRRYKERLFSTLQIPYPPICRESQFECYLESQICQILQPFLEFTFKAAADNKELTMLSMIDHYKTLIQRVNNVTILHSKKSRPQQSKRVDFGSQRSLKACNVWGISDFATSLAVGRGNFGIIPLFLNGIVEIEECLFKAEVIEVLTSIEEKLNSRTHSDAPSPGNQEDKKKKKYLNTNSESKIDFDSSSPFGKVFNKLLQQIVRCQCTKGLLMDGSHILFLELSDEVDSEGVFGLTLFGPFPLFDQEGIRLMILAFFSYDCDFDKMIEDKHQMLDVADQMKFYSSSEMSFKRWSTEQVKEKEDQPMIDKKSASTEGAEKSVSEVPSDMGSLPNASSHTEAPHYNPSLISCFDVNFIKYHKFLIHSRDLAFVFRIDPRFLEEFPSSILDIDDSHLKELIKESDVDKWPILKLYPPNCWDADAIRIIPSIEEAYGDEDDGYEDDGDEDDGYEDDGDEDDGYEDDGYEDDESNLRPPFADLMRISCNQVRKEAEILNRLSCLAGIPKVLVSGVMRDVSKQKSPDKFSILSTSFHGGFIVMNNVGNSLSDDEVKQLDDGTKKTILVTMKQIHDLDVVQGDVRADNIAVTSEATEAARTGRQGAYIIDFGNAEITKDKNLKRREQWEFENLLSL